jgi:alcohol dehydrogenase (cytochrome c)
MYSLILKRCGSAVAHLAVVTVCSALVYAQTIKHAVPAATDWPSYNGDTSGRRFSPLAQINRTNVKSLTVAWAFPTHGASLKGTPVMVDGVVYFTAPEKVWAVDAATGDSIWQFSRTSPGNHIGQRGVAVYEGKVFFGTPDARLICLDAVTGKQLWDVVVADYKSSFYLSVAPLVVHGKVILGTSGDTTDIPHFLAAFDPNTGAKLWQFNSTPKPGTPEAATWSDPQIMARGGGPMWLTGTYDPGTNLLYWGTGNPHPVVDGNDRKGANLYTCSILAIDPDTGKVAWYYQPSPHDTHDWDAVETPVLFDGNFGGKPRKMLAQASRNGYFFVLDRITGEHLLTTQFVPTNWSNKLDEKGQPIADPAKEPKPDGVLIQGVSSGGTNWYAPSYSPQTGLFYVSADEGYSFWYLALDENGSAEDHQGGAALSLSSHSYLKAIDPKTGKVRWQRDAGEGRVPAGILTTAGRLLFSGDTNNNVFALDPSNGATLWHTRLGAIMNNGPITYEVRGRQYVLMNVGDVVYAWALPAAASN